MVEVIRRALALQQRAAELGFDWPDVDGVWEKLAEELAELRRAAGEGPEREAAELGDVLLALLNLARHRGLDPVAALEGAVARFARRFAVVEAGAKELPPLNTPERLVAMEALWQQAKALERDGGLEGA